MAVAPELRTEMCPSSGRSRNSAERVWRASHLPCELGTIRSWPPCRNRTGGLTCPGSNPHGATYARSSSTIPPAPPSIACPATAASQDHAPAKSLGVEWGQSGHADHAKDPSLPSARELGLTHAPAARMTRMTQMTQMTQMTRYAAWLRRASKRTERAGMGCETLGVDCDPRRVCSGDRGLHA